MAIGSNKPIEHSNGPPNRSRAAPGPTQPAVQPRQPHQGRLSGQQRTQQAVQQPLRQALPSQSTLPVQHPLPPQSALGCIVEIAQRLSIGQHGNSTHLATPTPAHPEPPKTRVPSSTIQPGSISVSSAAQLREQGPAQAPAQQARPQQQPGQHRLVIERSPMNPTSLAAYSKSPYLRELEIAELAVYTAVLAASEILKWRDGIRDQQGSATKSDQSPVTVADYTVQAVMIAILHSVFTTDDFVGEESAHDLKEQGGLGLTKLVLHFFNKAMGRNSNPENTKRDIETLYYTINLGSKNSPASDNKTNKEFEFDPNKRYWVMDPIDGTSEFKKRKEENGQYAISLSLLCKGRVVVAVTAAPNLSFEQAVQEASPGCRSRGAARGTEHLGIIVSAVHGVYGARLWQVTEEGVTNGIHIKSVRSPPPIDEGIFYNYRLSLSSEFDGLPIHQQSNILPAILSYLVFLDSPQSKRTDSGWVDRLARGGYGQRDIIYASLMRYLEAAIRPRNCFQIRMPKEDRKSQHWDTWDHIGTTGIYEQCGGMVTDLLGRPLLFRGTKLRDTWGIVAADPEIHGYLILAIWDAFLHDEQTQRYFPWGVNRVDLINRMKQSPYIGRLRALKFGEIKLGEKILKKWALI
ncbi:hypothetical protein VTJ83DRAFT_2814 [Remersonia thermophila]|uniref:Uncharacterized protein n=1 Tax=Remersonia thermophila TaxID=72144 RepID=A0ABR4DC92_9PEZI